MKVVLDECSEYVIKGLECCVSEYFSTTNKKMAQELHNMFINVGWLEKYWMFADFFEKLVGCLHCSGFFRVL